MVDADGRVSAAKVIPHEEAESLVVEALAVSLMRAKVQKEGIGAPHLEAVVGHVGRVGRRIYLRGLTRGTPTGWTRPRRRQSTQ